MKVVSESSDDLDNDLLFMGGKKDPMKATKKGKKKKPAGGGEKLRPSLTLGSNELTSMNTLSTGPGDDPNSHQLGASRQGRLTVIGQSPSPRGGKRTNQSPFRESPARGSNKKKKRLDFDDEAVPAFNSIGTQKKNTIAGQPGAPRTP